MLAKQKMTVDEFLAWAQGREGRWELVDGVPVCMSPERVAHVETKFSAASALKGAIKKAGLRCEAFIDGLAIRVDQHRTFQPGVVINCGDRLGPGISAGALTLDPPGFSIEAQSLFPEPYAA